MQGIYIRGRRPADKKTVKMAVQDMPDRVEIEATSLHGGEYSGPASEYTGVKPVYFVGPDPYTSRKFYGTISRDKNGRLTVK